MIFNCCKLQDQVHIAPAAMKFDSASARNHAALTDGHAGAPWSFHEKHKVPLGTGCVKHQWM